ncbi:hypothetical protein H0H87_000858 [Tephrocybe sp. NHM501043]|nr:hypothetical protein H0H87_000858 [Tephrocybe sp. NHM501043]
MNPSVSTESVDVVQLAPPTPQEQTKAREKALKDRALKRLEQQERNHRLAEEACQAGDELAEKGDYAGASARYIDATNLWSSNSEFYLKLTKAYIKCELYADAAHAATRALSFDPKSLEARYTRGVARLEQGLLPAAKIDFETVIAHDPAHALAHTSLGRTLSLLQATKIGGHVVSPPSENATADGEPVDFAFPRYEDDKLELAEPSDSRCARGGECDFSHAPDEKSVRDDLGKNVCLYYLLSSCKFGDLKCIYSHSKMALPAIHGWWNDPEQIKRVKDVLELAEKKAKEQRAQDVLQHRLEAKKSRGKGQGRGKSRGDSSKSKERNSGKKPRNGKAAVTGGDSAQAAEQEIAGEDGNANRTETAPVERKEASADGVSQDDRPASNQTEATKMNVEKQGVGEPKKAEEPAGTKVEAKLTFAEPSAKSNGSTEAGEANGGFTDYTLNKPAAHDSKDETVPVAQEGLPY